MFWGIEYRHSSVLHCSEDSSSLSPHFRTSWLNVMSGSWFGKQNRILAVFGNGSSSLCLSVWAVRRVCQSPNGPCGPVWCVCKSFSWLVCSNYLWLLHSSAHESAWHAHCLWNIASPCTPFLTLHILFLYRHQCLLSALHIHHTTRSLLQHPKSKLRSPKAFSKPWAVSGQDISMTPSVLLTLGKQPTPLAPALLLSSQSPSPVSQQALSCSASHAMVTRASRSLTTKSSYDTSQICPSFYTGKSIISASWSFKPGRKQGNSNSPSMRLVFFLLSSVVLSWPVHALEEQPGGM